MLTALRIENFALIDYLELSLQSGLTVLTGETGAGKSIILDALDAVLGGKVSQRLVRAGSAKAILEASFALSPELQTWLAEQNLPQNLSQNLAMTPPVLVCKREILLGKTSVRSRSFLNGSPVTKAQLEALRQRLVEITAQGQTVQIGSPDRQRDWLDAFGGPTLLQQRDQVGQAYAAATAAYRRLEARRRAEQERRDRLDLLNLHQQELTQAGLEDPEEMDRLSQEHQRLSHSVELQQSSYQVYQMLYESEAGEGACADLLGQAEGILVDMERYDSSLAPILALVSEALTQVEEAGRAINAYGASVEADPQRLEAVEERLRLLKGLCRKYGRPLPELIAYRDEVNQTLADLSDQGQSLAALEADWQARQQELTAACATLSELRQETATRLESRLIQELKPLAMDRVQFQVALHPIAAGPAGADQIQFLFSPNPGEPLQPLAETASGGEMSRFLLALKACFSAIDGVDTLVFDEIDVGVSGRVAQAIAEKLLQLGQRHQVLCVTHQPMVAALADVHFRVGKQIVNDLAAATPPRASTRASKRRVEPAPSPDPADAVRTVVRITPLSLEQRREELAQLAGGTTHQQALSFAEALLSQANLIRQQL